MLHIVVVNSGANASGSGGSPLLFSHRVAVKGCGKKLRRYRAAPGESKENQGKRKKTCGFRRFPSSVNVYRRAFLFSVEFRLRWFARGFSVEFIIYTIPVLYYENYSTTDSMTECRASDRAGHQNPALLNSIYSFGLNICLTL